jgi:hypothetical protein
LGRLIVLLLEPRCDDGLAAWNLVDEGLDKVRYYPIVRTNEVVAKYGVDFMALKTPVLIDVLKFGPRDASIPVLSDGSFQ